jgi:hypothetical protein
MIDYRKHRHYWWIAIFILGDIVLFSSRAVYLDEPFFISLAKTPRDYGFFFRDVQWIFFGSLYPVFGGGSHPPAVTYYLVALYSFLGKFQEIPFRLLYSVFALAAGFGFYGLAQRLCRYPLGVTLLFLASPAFFVMAPTLMMDVPMLGFFLLGLHFFFGDRPWKDAASAFLFTLSVLSGYTAMIPLSCLFVAVIFTRQARSRFIVLAVAPSALVLWVIATTLYYGRSPLTPVVRYFVSVHSTAHNVLATPSFLGGVTMVPWLFLLLRPDTGKERPNTKVLMLISFVAAGFLSLCIDWRSAGYGLWFILLASSGVGLFLLFSKEVLRIARGEKNCMEVFLALWFPVTLLAFVVVAQFISARYLLLALPPLYLLLFRDSAAKRIAVTGVATMAVSLLVATADYRFVNSYPAWVSATIDPLRRQGFEVLGASESGLRFYLEQRGIPPLATADLTPKGGDLIVRHSTQFRYDLAESVEEMLTVLKTWQLNDGFPVRTFCLEAGAGFHGSSLGLVPYIFSRVPYDRLEIAEVSPFVERLPLVGAQGRPVPQGSSEGPILIQKEPVLSFPIKLPLQSRIDYDVDGPGSVEVEDGYVKLRMNSEEPIVWKNFRIVPDDLDAPVLQLSRQE